jgi:hypothetical protein
MLLLKMKLLTQGPTLKLTYKNGRNRGKVQENQVTWLVSILHTPNSQVQWHSQGKLTSDLLLQGMFISIEQNNQQNRDRDKLILILI